MISYFEKFNLKKSDISKKESDRSMEQYLNMHFKYDRQWHVQGQFCWWRAKDGLIDQERRRPTTLRYRRSFYHKPCRLEIGGRLL